MKFRIYYDDTDAQGIVYHSNFLKFCERARSEIFFANGVVFSPDSHFVVSHIDASFIKPAFLGDIIDVTTQIKEIKKASLILSQKIYKCSDNGEILIFSAEICVAYLKNKKIAKMNDEILKIIENFNI